MRFTEDKLNAIDNRLTRKKKEDPVKNNVIGVGIRLVSLGVVKENTKICEVEDLKRVIKELTMLKESIEEETGLIL